MNAHTRISEKGQVVVPKGTRDRLGWQPGTDLDIIETSDAITLRRCAIGGRLTVDQAVDRLRALRLHDGPPVPVEQLGWDAGAAEDQD